MGCYVMIIGAVIFFVFGLVLLFLKYRVILGGDKITGTVVRYEYFMRQWGKNKYRLIMSFIHDGIVLEKPTLNITGKPEKKIHATLSMYYNKRRPQYVLLDSWGWELLALFSVAAGCVITWFYYLR